MKTTVEQLTEEDWASFKADWSEEDPSVLDFECNEKLMRAFASLYVKNVLQREAENFKKILKNEYFYS